MTKETITLFKKEGSSDKFYTISIVGTDKKCSVPAEWGRRGTTGQSGFKAKDVTYEVAKKMFDKVVKEKMSDRYVVGEGLQGACNVQTEVKFSKDKCQLLNAIDETEVKKYLNNDAYYAQEKFDGKRMILRCEKSRITATNKKGIECAFPEEYGAFCIGKRDFAIDGESIGSNFYAFDALMLDGADLMNKPYAERYHLLSAFIKFSCKEMRLADIAEDSAEKLKLYKDLKTAKKEGIVFKRLDAKYIPGRPNSAGDQVKFKFYATASVIVIRQNVQNSVAIGVLDDGTLCEIGNVTTTGHEKPKVKDVIEVRYLYMYKGGSLYQPTYIGPRDDVDMKECVISQLKYKSEEEDNG